MQPLSLFVRVLREHGHCASAAQVPVPFYGTRRVTGAQATPSRADLNWDGQPFLMQALLSAIPFLLSRSESGLQPCLNAMLLSVRLLK